MKPSTPDEIMNAAMDQLQPEIEQATGCFARHLAEVLGSRPMECHYEITLGYWATVMRAVMHRFAVCSGHPCSKDYAHYCSLAAVDRMKLDLASNEDLKQGRIIPRPKLFSCTLENGVMVYGIITFELANRKVWHIWSIKDWWSPRHLGYFPNSPWPLMQKIIDKFEWKNFQWLDQDMGWPSHEEYLASLRD